MGVRVASLWLVFAFITLSAQAQPRTPPGPTIRELAERLAALEVRVGKVESGQVDAEDLVGTFSIHSLGIELQAAFGPRIGVETTRATMTLFDDGTGLFVGGGGRTDLQAGTPWSLTVRTAELGSGSFTWFVSNGMLIIPDDDDRDGDGANEPVELMIGARGHVLINGETSECCVDGGWNNVFMLIRLPDE